MSEHARLLRALHASERPLVLPNAWDARSARVFAAAGFPALATPSSGIAESLGYEDRQGAPAAEMFAAAARVARAVDVPVTVDAEGGYGLAPAELAERLLAAGAAGCNLEDSRQDGGPGLLDADEQAAHLAAVRRAAGDALVVNARVDVFLRRLGGTPEERMDLAVERATRYLEAGADCVYPIGLLDEDTIATLVKRVPGPVNVLFHDRGPTLARLGELGVARVTFGGGLYDAVMAGVGEMAARIRAGESPYA
ncbi:isocitrate lyase/PEP mutase family protein [Bailinhaonella thermotolerans]|uniref:Isocitrate lyase/phosphoenolpyruvate mutase family protein n=1 Tax=Bailinhaonella thermotolerans TaxID=1070861 RepID=A0A3A4AYL1_9ACTN|nr:isocitrate lyase/phosphoenolpyruvate mutase family protein [Bailinhaonella thermotolerans]RJL30947.1 isocitrate lyase/phosphoenolpyruvate mutase family protein [Bailinhaonella thermotolerans]